MRPGATEEMHPRVVPDPMAKPGEKKALDEFQYLKDINFLQGCVVVGQGAMALR